MRAEADASKEFPWYYAKWLRTLHAAERWLQTHDPAGLMRLRDLVSGLRTSEDFTLQRVDTVFDAATFATIVERIRTVPLASLEMHETRAFGRFVVHDDPYFTELHEQLTPLVSELAHEPVEPTYNFLSLYTRLGVCPLHLDAPSAKWTLDVCIEQSEPWPISFSQVVPWPDRTPSTNEKGDQWQDAVLGEPSHRFESVSLEPNQAVLFSGSSQWHYRDPLPTGPASGFCSLLFFHFVPKGLADAVAPGRWADLIGVPELANIVGNSAAGPNLFVQNR